MMVLTGVQSASGTVLFSYLYLLVTNENFQTLTSIIQATRMASDVIASELGQFLVLKGISYDFLASISIAMEIVQFLIAFLLPKDIKVEKKIHSFSLSGQKEFWKMIKETWRNKNLQLLSFWWVVFFAGILLVLNYGANIFEGISSTSTYNGHMLALGTATGFLSALSAIYLEKAASVSGGLIYIMGTAAVAIFCFSLANFKILWAAYALFIAAVAIEKVLICLIYAQCGRLLPNDEYALLFSFNTVIALLIQALLQAVLEMLGRNIFQQYEVMGVYFLVFTLLFSLFCLFRYKYTGTFVLVLSPNSLNNTSSPTEHDPLIPRAISSYSQNP